MFKKYMHVEKFGNDEVHGIELGKCFIFPKLDGTNASVWVDDDGNIRAGSRNREITPTDDNQGFAKFAYSEKKLIDLMYVMPGLRLYGEWLVPHTITSYRAEAWKKFYVFDVYNDRTEEFVPYDCYQEWLEDFSIDYIPAYSTMKNAQYDNLLKELERNDFLMKEGYGEGIVIKNYDFKNKYGRVTWAKIVTSSFKENHKKTMGPDEKNFSDLVEEKIVNKYLSKDIVEKTYAKIVNEEGGWNSKQIPRLLNTVYHDFIVEELWQAIKEHKNPKVDFKTLHLLSMNKIKEHVPHVFGR